MVNLEKILLDRQIVIYINMYIKGFKKKFILKLGGFRAAEYFTTVSLIRLKVISAKEHKFFLNFSKLKRKQGRKMRYY